MHTLSFEGRVAIVTGAGSGMGRLHALTLAERGARVVVNDIRRSAAESVVAEIAEVGGTAVTDAHDIVTGAGDVVGTATATFGRLDILINNAGVPATGDRLTQLDPDSWWRQFDVHVRGTVNMSRAAWPHLVASGTGRVVNVSSPGLLGSDGASAYSAAKGAIFGFSKSLAQEGSDAGVLVNILLPSAWTPMTAGAFTNSVVIDRLERFFDPAHISAFVAWLVHQDTTVSNEAFNVNAGRAARVTLAAFPAITATESTPEAWARAGSNLTAAEGDLVPYFTTSEMFTADLAAADPTVIEALGGRPADEL